MSRSGALFLSALVAILGGTLDVGRVHAGANHLGHAVLSWSVDGRVSDIGALPDSGAQVYLELIGAPEITELGVTLRLSPAGQTGACYYVTSADTVGGPCAWNIAAGDSMSFAGDSTYTWNIRTQDGLPPTCIVYLVRCRECSGHPGTICLSDVVTRDSEGRIDHLMIDGGVSVLGGAGNPCVVQPRFVGSAAVERVDPDGDGEAEALDVSSRVVLEGTAPDSACVVVTAAAFDSTGMLTERASLLNSLPVTLELHGKVGDTLTVSCHLSGEDLRGVHEGSPVLVSLAAIEERCGARDTVSLVVDGLSASEFGEVNSRILGLDDSAIDLDGDDSFDHVQVLAQVRSSMPGRIHGIAVVSKDSLTLGIAEVDSAVAAGVSVLRIPVSAAGIHAAAIDGPYSIDVWTSACATDGHASAQSEAYVWSEFWTTVNLDVAGSGTMDGADLDGNGRFELAECTIPVEVSKAGTYYVDAVLGSDSAGTGDTVAVARAVVTLPSSGFCRMRIGFSGEDIASSGKDGQYYLTTVVVRESTGAVLDARNDIDLVWSDRFRHSQFGAYRAGLVRGFRNASYDVVDADSDGKIDTLSAYCELFADTSGSVVLSGELRSSAGVLLGSAKSTGRVDARVWTPFRLGFPGGPVYARGLNGPYRVGNCLARFARIDSGGVDFGTRDSVLLTTDALLASEFRPVPVVYGRAIADSSVMNGAVVFLDPCLDRCTTSSGGMYRLGLPVPTPDSVTVRMQPALGRALDGWKAIAEGILVGNTRWATVHVDSGQALRLDFVRGDTSYVLEVREHGLAPELTLLGANPMRGSQKAIFRVGGWGRSKVTIDVFDVMGRRVERLLNHRVVAGSAIVEWKPGASGGRGMSGVFFVRAQGEDDRLGSVSIVRRVVVLR